MSPLPIFIWNMKYRLLRLEQVDSPEFSFLQSRVRILSRGPWSSLVEGEEQLDRPNSQTCMEWRRALFLCCLTWKQQLIAYLLLLKGSMAQDSNPGLQKWGYHIMHCFRLSINDVHFLMQWQVTLQAVAVAQLAEWSLSKPEVWRSWWVIGKFLNSTFNKVFLTLLKR